MTEYLGFDMDKIELKNSMPKRGDFLDTEFGKAEIVEDPERSFELSSGAISFTSPTYRSIARIGEEEILIYWWDHKKYGWNNYKSVKTGKKFKEKEIKIMKKKDVEKVPPHLQVGSKILGHYGKELTIKEKIYVAYESSDLKIYKTIATDEKGIDRRIGWKVWNNRWRWGEYHLDGVFSAETYINAEKIWSDRHGELTVFEEKKFDESSGNFVATAEDELGAIYTLRWECTNQKYNEDCEACDWTKFSVEKI